MHDYMIPLSFFLIPKASRMLNMYTKVSGGKNQSQISLTSTLVTSLQEYVRSHGNKTYQ